MTKLSTWKNDDDSKSDQKMDRGHVYAPNAFEPTVVKLPPGVSMDSLVCYASIEGQD